MIKFGNVSLIALCGVLITCAFYIPFLTCGENGADQRPFEELLDEAARLRNRGPADEAEDAIRKLMDNRPQDDQDYSSALANILRENPGLCARLEKRQTTLVVDAVKRKDRTAVGMLVLHKAPVVGKEADGRGLMEIAVEHESHVVLAYLTSFKRVAPSAKKIIPGAFNALRSRCSAVLSTNRDESGVLYCASIDAAVAVREGCLGTGVGLYNNMFGRKQYSREAIARATQLKDGHALRIFKKARYTMSAEAEAVLKSFDDEQPGLMSHNADHHASPEGGDSREHKYRGDDHEQPGLLTHVSRNNNDDDGE